MCFRVLVSVERKRVMQEVETNAKGGGDWWLGARVCIRRAGYLLLQVGSRHFGGVSVRMDNDDFGTLQGMTQLHKDV